MLMAITYLDYVCACSNDDLFGNAIYISCELGSAWYIGARFTKHRVHLPFFGQRSSNTLTSDKSGVIALTVIHWWLVTWSNWQLWGGRLPTSTINVNVQDASIIALARFHSSHTLPAAVYWVRIDVKEKNMQLINCWEVSLAMKMQLARVGCDGPECDVHRLIKCSWERRLRGKMTNLCTAYNAHCTVHNAFLADPTITGHAIYKEYCHFLNYKRCEHCKSAPTERTEGHWPRSCQ